MHHLFLKKEKKQKGKEEGRPDRSERIENPQPRPRGKKKKGCRLG